MQLFYSPEITNGDHVLDKMDSRHCLTVLRKKEGDFINIVDGKGGFYNCQIIDANPKRCAFEIVQKESEFAKLPYQLHIAIAPTKSIDRFEFFLEKATEFGITEITPIMTFHSERKVIKPERLQKILVSAMKQSVKAYLPILNPMVKWKDFVKQQAGNDQNDYQGIACLSENTVDFFQDYKGGNATVLIGPEGGFSNQEIEEAVAIHFKKVSLGKSRLRTETAGIAVCNIVQVQN